MTENKRFEVFKSNIMIGINDNGKSIGNVYAACDLLNELNDECEFLKIENESLEDGVKKYVELCHKSLKENEKLKELLMSSGELDEDEIAKIIEYKRFDIYFDDYMQLWTVSDNENDNMLYPCTTENMANEFAELLNELNDEKEKWKSKANKKEKGVLDD